VISRKRAGYRKQTRSSLLRLLDVVLNGGGISDAAMRVCE